MTEIKALLERADRAVSDVPLPADGLEGLQRRRDRKRRNQRIAAGVVGIAVFVAAVWAVTSGGSFNRTEQPAIKPPPTLEPSSTAPEAY
jgi:ferric-dicitrate binding protein FerR (iron transport regulator)